MKKRIIHHKKKKSWITLNFANHHQPLDNSSTSDSHLRFSALDNIIAPHTFPHSTATHQLLLAFAHLKNTLKKNTAKVNEFDYLVVENPTSRTFACFAALRNMNMKEKKYQNLFVLCAACSFNSLTKTTMKKNLKRLMMIWNKSNSLRVIFKRHFWFINLRLNVDSSPVVIAAKLKICLLFLQTSDIRKYRCRIFPS